MFEKLNGIIEAINGEAKVPNPSHKNLARLTGMALEEVKAICFDLSSRFVDKPVEPVAKEELQEINITPSIIETVPAIPKKTKSKKAK